MASGVDRQQRTSRQSRTSASRSGRADVPQSGLPKFTIKKNLLPDDDEQTGRLSTITLEDHRENLLPDDDEQTGRLSTTLLEIMGKKIKLALARQICHLSLSAAT